MKFFWPICAHRWPYINGKLSDSFLCQTEVRQGDNLSPLLFAIYLHDLGQFLEDKHNVLNLLNLKQPTQ